MTTNGLRYLNVADMGVVCRPIGRVDVFDLDDRRVGKFDGLLLDTAENVPRYLVIRKSHDDEVRWTVVPVGNAWFDETRRAMRVDAERPVSFDPVDVERLSSPEAHSFESDLLRQCCPEELHGTEIAYSGASFRCPAWLRLP